MARGNSPVCIATVGVTGPSPDSRQYGFGAPSLMSCGLKWVCIVNHAYPWPFPHGEFLLKDWSQADSGRQQYHNLTSISYKPCFWLGSPFPEYIQVDLEFHTHDESRRDWYQQLNETKNEKLKHEMFCNTPKHFHALDQWPQQPYEDHVVWDDTLKGSNPRPVDKKTIRANMVNKTGLRTDPVGMADLSGYI